MQEVNGIGPATAGRLADERARLREDGRKSRPFGSEAQLLTDPGQNGRRSAITSVKLAKLKTMYKIGYRAGSGGS